MLFNFFEKKSSEVYYESKKRRDRPASACWKWSRGELPTTDLCKLVHPSFIPAWGLVRFVTVLMTWIQFCMMLAMAIHYWCTSSRCIDGWLDLRTRITRSLDQRPSYSAVSNHPRYVGRRYSQQSPDRNGSCFYKNILLDPTIIILR